MATERGAFLGGQPGLPNLESGAPTLPNFWIPLDLCLILRRRMTKFVCGNKYGEGQESLRITQMHRAVRQR